MAEDHLELLIFVSAGIGDVLPHPVCVVLGIKPSALHVIGKHCHTSLKLFLLLRQVSELAHVAQAGLNFVLLLPPGSVITPCFPFF